MLFLFFFPIPVVSGEGVGVSGQALDIIVRLHELVKKCDAFVL